MKKIKNVLMLCFMLLGITVDLSAQQLNCYTKGEYKSTFKVLKSEVTYNFTIKFCKAAISHFTTTSDTDKVLLLTIVKNVGDKKGIGKYEATYKIASSQEYKDEKESYLFIATLLKATKTEITAPDEIDSNKLTMYLTYNDDYNSLLLQDRNLNYFFKTAELLEDDGHGW